MYYGQIEEIWELLYVGFKVPIFCCRWVQVSQGVMKDRYGFTTVDLNQVGYRDTRNKKRQVVLPRKKRVVGLENPVDEEEFNQSNEVPPLDTSILPMILESELTTYLRDGHKEVAPGQKDTKNDKYAKKDGHVSL